MKLQSHPTIQIYPTGNGYRLAGGVWPRILRLSDHQVRDRAYAKFAWPYLTLQVENGRAVYRVETCEQGMWDARLVEGWANLT